MATHEEKLRALEIASAQAAMFERNANELAQSVSVETDPATRERMAIVRDRAFAHVENLRFLKRVVEESLREKPRERRRGRSRLRVL